MDLNGSLFDAINDLAGHLDLADDAMQFAAQYLTYVVFALVVVSWFVRTGSDQSRRLAVYSSAITAALSLGAVFVVHHFYVHQRPFVQRDDVVLLIRHAADSSFPSEHATESFALAAGLIMYRFRYGMMLIGVAVLVALSRVYVGVHYPYDVLGGAAIGIFFALALRSARPALEWMDRSVVAPLIPGPLR